MKKYHINKNGSQSGPLTEKEIQHKITNGELSTSDYCWTEGMQQWQTIENTISLTSNPYSPPNLSKDYPHAMATQIKHYGGIRRLPYVGIIIGLSLFQAIVTASDPSGVGILVLLFGCFFTVYYRLKNIGINPWWCLLMIVPIANILIGFRCLAFQEGYQDTKKLDKTGKIITYVVVGFFALLILLVAVSLIAQF